MQITFDFVKLDETMRKFGAAEDQIPFAISLAMNNAIEETRWHLIRNTWPTHVTQRNKSFISAALTTKGQKATKTNLHAMIYDTLKRGNLPLHAYGGVRVAKRGHMAIPTSKSGIPKTASGIPMQHRPRNMQNAFRRRDAIYVRTGGRLKLMYVLKKRVVIPKRVPFAEEFERVVSEAMRKSIPYAVARAMATRRVP